MESLTKELYKNCESFTKQSQANIKSAYLFAYKKHDGQMRLSGEPYIIHPLTVATKLAKDGHDSVSVVAGLLHDTLEDTETSKQELVANFGEEVAKIVDGVTKISTLRIKDKTRLFGGSEDDMFLEGVDNYRKLILAMISDIRTIVIKLYDRLHNIETIKFIPEQKKEFYAKETIAIFAPIAERLGMGEMKGVLEDISFPYAYPNEYEKFIKIAKKAYKNPEKTINRVIPQVKKTLNSNQIKYDSIAGRAKHHYSLFVKLKDKKEITQVFDIVAMRVIVFSLEDCYQTLGIIHTLFTPLVGRIFDYISRPKSSGYQSLHTTVKDDEGNIFEIQIRTKEMHEIAEFGVAAHWNYKDGNPKSANDWLSELKKIEKIKSGKQLIKTIKEELFSERVFVFTPYGDVLDLPLGSCGIDFAYKIHTDLGNKCNGVKINNRLMPIKTILRTGDVVEIIKSNKSTPTKDWLSFVKTATAKTKISHFLRKKDSERFAEIGKSLYETEIEKLLLPQKDIEEMKKLLSSSRLPYKDLHSAYAAIGERHLGKYRLIKIMYPTFSLNKTKKIVKHIKTNKISSLEGIKHVFADCCKPTTKDNLSGYLSKDHVIKIHKTSCKRIKNADPNRIISL